MTANLKTMAIAAAALAISATAANAGILRFEAQLKGEHARLNKQAATSLGVQRWSLNFHVAEPPVPPAFPFEAIDESWFATIPEAAAALTSTAMHKLTEDLTQLTDVTQNITMLTRPTHRWPKPPKPEAAAS